MLRKPILALLLLALVAAAGPVAAQTCTATSSWVDDPTLPDAVPGNEGNHCDFAIFSWQSFLALTEVADQGTGQLLFETYMDTDGLFPPDGTNPTPWGSEPWPLTLSDITQQAGSGNDLIAQNGLEVQYDMSVNQTMYNYITSNLLYNATCFNAGVTNQSIRMPPTSSTDTADESIELKTAWMPVTSCNPSQYHCTKAVINGATQTVALIGIHIVHKLPDHQEWIWSSFEHVANSPDCAKVTSPPSGYSSWNFFKTGFVNTGSACPACPNNGGSCDASTQCNTFVSENQVPNICRTTQLSSLTCDTTDTNLNDDLNDVLCLNQSVQSLLPSSSVWRNYMLVGTIWFKPGMSAPDNSGQTPPSGQTEVGNLTLANSVMETYTQANNCFNCHTNTFKAFNAASAETSGHADFSHIFNRIQAVKQVTCPTISTQSSHSTKKTAEAPAPFKPKASHGYKK